MHKRNAVPISVFVKPNLYKDSVALMRIARALLARDGVQHATLMMGTPANKAILDAAGLLASALQEARPGDLMIAIDAETRDAADAAQAEALTMLDGTSSVATDGDPASSMPMRSIAMARARGAASATLAQISVPGPYAAAEALKALRQGLHVFLFSDNVPLEQERAIKRVARHKGLLVMGPDCGTAIIGGVPLGFANVVADGAIGLVGASGTGLQEVTCQVDALGHGIRHAIGTGGRDVCAEIGGSTMLQALDLLAADDATRVIGVVSKPPAPAIASRVLKRLGEIGKPAVVLFLGAHTAASVMPPNVFCVDTLHDVALAAVALLEGRRFEREAPRDDEARLAEAEAHRLAPGQRFVRGLYSGGTFCTEAQLVWGGMGLRVHSNASVDKHAQSADAEHRHSAIDLGDDEFTVGRPHPMIDPSARIERFASDALDPSTAVIVLDVVLGFAAHDDPAGALAPAIAQAMAVSAKERRHLSIVAFVCGTEGDPQRLSVQLRRLREAGAIVQPNSTAAARLAGEIAVRAATLARSSLESVQ